MTFVPFALSPTSIASVNILCCSLNWSHISEKSTWIVSESDVEGAAIGATEGAATGAATLAEGVAAAIFITRTKAFPHSCIFDKG